MVRIQFSKNGLSWFATAYQWTSEYYKITTGTFKGQFVPIKDVIKTLI